MVKTQGTETLGQAAATVQDDDLVIEDVLRIIKRAIEDKKGENVRILDLEDEVDYLDYIVLASGFTELHNQALAEEVRSELARYDIIPEDVQGYRRGDWILLDYGVVVVHLFLPAVREFYRLEELWSGGKPVVV